MTQSVKEFVHRFEALPEPERQEVAPRRVGNTLIGGELELEEDGRGAHA